VPQPICHMFRSDADVLKKQWHEFHWHSPLVVEINGDATELGRDTLSSRSYYAVPPPPSTRTVPRTGLVWAAITAISGREFIAASQPANDQSSVMVRREAAGLMNRKMRAGQPIPAYTLALPGDCVRSREIRQGWAATHFHGTSVSPAVLRQSCAAERRGALTMAWSTARTAAARPAPSDSKICTQASKI
jgi:hypothetical protein